MAVTEASPPTVTYPHLTIRDGVARIGDTRFKVIHLAASHHFMGWGAEELLRQYPDLKPEEVYAALTYFYDHREEMIAKMEEDEREHAEMAKAQRPTREELLQRLQARQG